MAGRHSRRALLGAVKRTAALAPFVPLLGRDASAATPIRRLMVIYTPNGVYGPDWMPQGSETGWTLPASTRALEPFKHDLIFVKGVDIKEDAANRAHPCQELCLTGSPKPAAEKGTSVDQVVAAELTKTTRTRFPYLQFHTHWVFIEPTRSPYWSNGQPLVGETDVYRAFEKVFAGGLPAVGAGGGPPPPDARRLRRKSVMDYVSRELAMLHGSLTGDDRQKVEAHQDAVRRIEHLFSEVPPAAAGKGCRKVALAEGLNGASAAGHGPAGQAFGDIAVAALACDLTRVVCVGWGRGGGGPKFSWLGGVYAQFDHHSITHGDAGSKGLTNKIDQWYATEVASLLTKLKNTPDGAGTLLDSTLVLWANEFGAWAGSQHWRKDIPYMIAGGKWAWKTGRLLTCNSEPHGKLLVSVARAMGAQVNGFGSSSAKFGMGPLAALG